MYVLFLFYHACAPDMAAARPLGKFLTIKAVVFLSFWQVCFKYIQQEGACV